MIRCYLCVPCIEYSVCVCCLNLNAVVLKSLFKKGFACRLCVPLSIWNLDDNVIVQVVAMALIGVATVIMVPYVLSVGGIHTDSINAMGSNFHGAHLVSLIHGSGETGWH